MTNPDDELVFNCPACGAGLKTRQELAGREAACPKCKARITIPTDDAD